MASFEITGMLIAKEDTIKRTETFSVREFVLEIAGERFSDYIKMQLSNDKCALIDTALIGDTLTVSFNLRGRKWDKDGKTTYFNSLDAWRVKVESNFTQQQPTTFVTTSPVQGGEVINGDGDLPF